MEELLEFYETMGVSRAVYNYGQQALDKLIGRVHPGAVVLLHATSATNAAVLEEVILKWKEMGYTFGTLAELCGG